MGRFMIATALSAALLVAGCASAPEVADRAVATDLGADSTRSADRQAAEVTPDAVVDARDPNPGGTVTCREMLKQGSNVIIKQCMTLDDWKTFERRQEQDAKEVLRTLQGGAYR